jgi:hypothetical protein
MLCVAQHPPWIAEPKPSSLLPIPTAAAYGSLRPLARRESELSSNNQIAEIAPLQILALDQLDLPVPLPALELLFTGNCLIRPLERLDINPADKRRRF